MSLPSRQFGADADSGSAVDRYLFIAGCPRSGTSALAFLLNEHPRIVLGFERFKRMRGLLDPFHFTPSQFFSPVLAETDIQGDLLYRRLYERWQGGSVSVIGDKVPLYTRVLPQLLERFPGARVVVLVRELVDVAVSFDRRAGDPEDWWPAENGHRLAVEMWNETIEQARAATGQGNGDRLFLLPYEPLLMGDERWLTALMSFIGLPSTARLRAEHRRLAERWRGVKSRTADAELLAYVEANQDLTGLSWAREQMDRQLERVLASRAQARDEDDREDELPLTAQELSERTLEQEQLLEEMRRPGRRRVGELETLERRLLEQTRELVRRGERAARGARPADDSFGEKPRVTFILPHQRPTTGGVYVVEQFARHLAPYLTATIMVRKETARPVPGVAVRTLTQLDPDALPDAEILVYPADMPDASELLQLPARVGRPVMLFQGYGTPGSPVVLANLSSARASVAIAHWLVEDALRRGAPCVYVPQGLDRDVFAPGLPSSERPPRVSVMTHRLDWKGLEDALKALSIVRATRADVEVVLFGTEPVAGVGSFVEAPARAQVASLLRASAVHVVTSWEEGFGLTGAEAIACGAALVTTDTKGSRDYAVDGCTALVSPPRDPGALARNVLKLLDDIETRTRLVIAGQRHLRGVMPPWPEAARRMAVALLDF